MTEVINFYGDIFSLYLFVVIFVYIIAWIIELQYNYINYVHLSSFVLLSSYFSTIWIQQSECVDKRQIARSDISIIRSVLHSQSKKTGIISTGNCPRSWALVMVMFYNILEEAFSTLYFVFIKTKWCCKHVLMRFVTWEIRKFRKIMGLGLWFCWLTNFMFFLLDQFWFTFQ